MTIAIVSMIRDSWGGSEELWYDMAKEALQKGFKVIHLRYDHPQIHPKIEELKDKGLISLTRPGWIPSSLKEVGRKILIAKNFLRKKLNPPFKYFSENPPHVLLYNGTCYSIAEEKELLKYLQTYKGRFFILGHFNNENENDLNGIKRNNVINAYRRAEKVFFVSKRSLEVAERQLGIKLQNTEVIRNPVNRSSVEYIEYPSFLKEVNIACVANLVISHKGQDKLLKALSQWSNKNWKLNFYGDGEDRDFLEKLVIEYELGDRVKFHGRVSNVDIIWHQNHALFLPSLMEGMPLAIVEAMLAGRICLATDVGGATEWIEDGVHGYIISKSTPEDILQVLQKAFQKFNSWEQMGKKAHERAKELYDPFAGRTLLNRIIAP